MESENLLVLKMEMETKKGQRIGNLWGAGAEPHDTKIANELAKL